MFILELISSLTRSDWIAIASIIVSVVIAALVFYYGRKASFRQRLERQAEIKKALRNAVDHDVELYNARLYFKKYFYENKKTAFRGYCYQGCRVKGFDIDGIECVHWREEWEQGEKIEVVGIIPYDWVQYIKYGDGSTPKAIIFVRAPWFREFPFRRDVYYRYGRDNDMDKYTRLRKSFKQKVNHVLGSMGRRAKAFYLRYVKGEYPFYVHKRKP